MSRCLVKKIPSIFKPVVRYSHDNFGLDRKFMNSYRELGKIEIRRLETRQELDKLVRQLKYYNSFGDDWDSSHLKHIMTEGERDDIFLL